MTGTGLKKCNPPNLSFLSGVAEAISPMDRDEVLDAKMVFSGARASHSLKSFRLSSRFSTTASTTRSAVLSASSACVAVDSLAEDSDTNFSAAAPSSCGDERR